MPSNPNLEHRASNANASSASELAIPVEHCTRLQRIGDHFIVTGATQTDVLADIRALLERRFELLSGPVLHERDWVAVLGQAEDPRVV